MERPWKVSLVAVALIVVVMLFINPGAHAQHLTSSNDGTPSVLFTKEKYVLKRELIPPS